MTALKCVAAILLSACAAINVLARPVVVSYRSASPTTVVSTEKYIRTELYFGSSRKGGLEISGAEFEEFIDEFVTPRFPSGLTVLDAHGQWRGANSTIINERSKVLVLIYPRRERRSADTKIEEIRAEYKTRFSQESVLRVDITKGVKVEF